MGFRSMVVSEDRAIEWPEWFIDKYGELLIFGDGHSGPFMSIREQKAESAFSTLHADIQDSIDWSRRTPPFVFIFLHECGGVTRCCIKKDVIEFTEPESWRKTEGSTHGHADGCT